MILFLNVKRRRYVSVSNKFCLFSDLPYPPSDLTCYVFKFHYNLGKALYSVCRGIDSDDTILLITSQIYYGKDYIANDDELRIPIVKLSMDAGKKAIESCRHDLAYSHLEAASSLLPEDCWESQYDISLRLNFMMADAANSSCKYDEAVIILEKIIDEGRCTKDKLTTYFLLIQSKCDISPFTSHDLMLSY